MPQPKKTLKYRKSYPVSCLSVILFKRQGSFTFWKFTTSPKLFTSFCPFLGLANNHRLPTNWATWNGKFFLRNGLRRTIGRNLPHLANHLVQPCAIEQIDVQTPGKLFSISRKLSCGHYKTTSSALGCHHTM